MLPLLAIAHIIGVRPIKLGRGRIVLLDATLHFGKQRFLQAFCVSKRALAIIVFGLQIGEYRRIELKRIAHHFAPVLRLEPDILVDEAEVVEGALKGTLLRLWLGRRARGPRGMKVAGAFLQNTSNSDQELLNGALSPATSTSSTSCNAPSSMAEAIRETSRSPSCLLRLTGNY